MFETTKTNVQRIFELENQALIITLPRTSATDTILRLWPSPGRKFVIEAFAAVADGARTAETTVQMGIDGTDVVDGVFVFASGGATGDKLLVLPTGENIVPSTGVVTSTVSTTTSTAIDIQLSMLIRYL